ncbi:MAG: pentapeptide repeat-containing protein [Leptolyngbya sp. SIO1E4]|nr:pentapeptide repeat-containing protein [Leptolyngbya sp. SIO1E4]
MAERGQYHGQRLTAQTVLRRYAAGERDFRGAILRGCNFRGAELSGADFSGADIRSARFVAATLRGAKLCHAQAGLQRRWVIGQLAGVIVIAALAGLLQGFAGAWVGFFFTTDNPGDLVIAIASVIVMIIVFGTLARQGFTLKALGSIAVAFAGAGAGAVAVVGAGAGAGAVAGAGAGAGAGAVAVAFAGAFAGAFAVAVAVAVAVAFAFAGAFAGAGAFAFAGAFAGASLLLSIYINRCIHRLDPKFENLRIIGLAFAALGGTTFSGADLTGATFAHAHLKSTNFADSRQRPTTLTHVRWRQAQNLDRARLGTSPLQDPRVRALLTTLNGTDQDLANADLRGVNLAGAQLHRANLKGANINGATLHGAELHGANLTQAQCIATNFTAAHLTAACLEAWNIDSTTILQDLDCQYVYLLEHPDARGNRERRPHHPDKDFQPGDFEKLFKALNDQVQILIRYGIQPEAFAVAFHQLMETYADITPDSIRGIEKRGDDVLLTVQTSENLDKGAVEQTFEAEYQARLGLLSDQAAKSLSLVNVEQGAIIRRVEAHYEVQLQMKEEEISILKEAIERVRTEREADRQTLIQQYEAELTALKTEYQDSMDALAQDYDHKAQQLEEKYQAQLEQQNVHATKMHELLKISLEQKIIVKTEAHAMNHSNNPNITTSDGSVYAGRDISLSGSTLNLGEISGQVSNQINQLSEAAPSSDQPSLKNILTQLQAAIEQDAELSADEKAEALGEIGKLAKAGSDPQAAKMKGLAKRATATLKSIAETLTDASKLATACKTLLPTLVALF